MQLGLARPLGANLEENMSNLVNRKSCLIWAASIWLFLNLCACTDNQSPSQSQDSAITKISGELKVFYDLQTSETTTVGTGPSGLEVSEIHFFDQYIVIKKDAEDGQVLPLSRIKFFRWQQSQ